MVLRVMGHSLPPGKSASFSILMPVMAPNLRGWRRNWLLVVQRPVRPRDNPHAHAPIAVIQVEYRKPGSNKAYHPVPEHVKVGTSPVLRRPIIVYCTGPPPIFPESEVCDAAW